MLNAIHLQSLVAVLDAGSLAGAAKSLGYTTSAVSQQIGALEREVGVPLFERGPRSLWPTAAGLQMGRHASAVLARLDEAEEDMAGYARGGQGRLRIAAFPTVGAQLLPRALAHLVESFPAAELSFSDQHSPPQIAREIAAGRCDLGAVYEYPQLPVSWPGDLVRRVLLREELVVLCGPAQPAGPPPSTAGAPLDSLRELADRTWLSTLPDSPGHENLLRLCGQAGFEPTVRFHSNDYDVIRGFVRQRLGVAMVPALAMGTDRTLPMRRLRTDAPCRTVALLWRSSDPNPLVAAAVAAMTTAAAEFVAWTSEAFPDQAADPLAVMPRRWRDPAHGPGHPSCNGRAGPEVKEPSP